MAKCVASATSRVSGQLANTLGDDIFDDFSVQLPDDLAELVAVHLDAHAVQDLLDAFGTGGGIALEGGQHVDSNLAHLSGSGQCMVNVVRGHLLHSGSP